MNRPQRSDTPISLEAIQNPLSPSEREVRPFGPPLGTEAIDMPPRRPRVVQNPLSARPQRSDQPLAPEDIRGGSPMAAPDIRRHLGRAANIAQIVEMSENPDEELAKILSAEYLSHKLGVRTEEVLADFDRYSQEYYGLNITPQTVFQAARNAVQRGQASYLLGRGMADLSDERAIWQGDGTFTPEQEARFLELKRQGQQIPPPDETNRRFLGRQWVLMVEAALEQVPRMLNSMAHAVPGALQDASAASLAAAVGGLPMQAVPVLGQKAHATSVAGTFAATFGGSMKVRSTMELARAYRGMTFMEIMDRVENGRRPDARHAAAAATAAGAFAGASEFFALSMIPGVSKVSQTAFNTALTRALSRNLISNRVLNAAARHGASVGFGVLNEIYQETMQILGTELGLVLDEGVNGGRWDRPTADEIKNRLGQIAAMAGRSYFLLGAPGTIGNMISPPADVRAIQQGTRTIQQLETLRAKVLENVEASDPQVRQLTEQYDKILQDMLTEPTRENIGSAISIAAQLDRMNPDDSLRVAQEMQGVNPELMARELWQMTREDVARMEQVTAQNMRDQLAAAVPDIGEDASQIVSSVFTAFARAAGMDLNAYLESRLQGFQRVDPVPGLRGAVQLFQDIAGEYRGVVQLAPNADLSTILHEVFHIEERRAAAGNVSIFSGEDYQLLRGWANNLMDTDPDAVMVESGEWTQDQFIAEKITDAFERYLGDGLAPDPQLQTLFAKVAEFFRKIYDSLFSRLPELNPEVRGVFDRVFSPEARAAREAHLFATPEGRAELAQIREAQGIDSAEQTLFQRDAALTPPEISQTATVIGTPQVKTWVAAVNQEEKNVTAVNKKAKKIPPLTRAYAALAELNERVQLSDDNKTQVEQFVGGAISDIISQAFEQNDQQILEALTWYDRDIGYMREALTTQIPELASDEYWYPFLAIAGVTSMRKKPVQNLWAAMSVMKFWMRTGEMPVFQFDSAYNNLYDQFRNETEEVQTKAGKTRNKRKHTDAEARQMAEQQAIAEGIKSNWNYRVFGLTEGSQVGAIQGARPVMGQKLLELQRLFNNLEGDVTKLREFLAAEMEGRDINALTGAKNLTLGGTYNGMEFIGPKVGQFALALGGDQNFVVKDLWFSRFWNRQLGTPWQSYEMNTENARLSSRSPEELAAETPRNKLERRAMEGAVADARARLAAMGHEVTPSQIQALLWNYEKRIYRDLDLLSDDEQSYRDGANSILAGSSSLVPTDGSGFISGDPQQVLQEIAAARREMGIDAAASTDGVNHILASADQFVQSEPALLRGLDLFFQRTPTNTPEFRAWFSDSKVVGSQGQPLVTYHATAAENGYAAFDTSLSDGGAHFGSIGQAAEILRSKEYDHSRMYPVYLSIQNPIQLTDFGNFYAENVFRDLANRGIVSPQEAAQMSNRVFNLDGRPMHSMAMPEIARERNRIQQQMLKDLGFDGIQYYNRREGLSNDMWDSLAEIAEERTKRGILWEGTSAGWSAYRVLDSFTDEQFVQFAEAHGIEPQLSYIAFDPTQIKSIYNRGSWDQQSPQMYAQRAAVSVEARPGLTTGDRWSWMQSLTYEQQQQLLGDAFAALRDADGVNGLARMYGIPEVEVIETPGSWEGQTNPSYQLQLDYDQITPEVVDQIESYAAALGMLFRQDGVGWNSFNPTAENPSGILLRVGRVITPAEIAAIDQQLGTMGGFAPVGTGQGLHILNFSDMSGAEAAQALDAFLRASDVIQSEYEIGPAEFDGGLVENNWQEQPNGEGYILRNMAAGASSIIERAGRLYGPAVDSAYQAFERRVRPQGPQQFFQGAANRHSTPLYSALELAASNLKQKKGTGAQMLAALQKTPGVTAEEIFWSGLEEFLQDRNSVTAEEIQAHIDANRVRVVEKRLVDYQGMGLDAYTEAIIDRSIENHREWIEDTFERLRDYPEQRLEFFEGQIRFGSKTEEQVLSMSHQHLRNMVEAWKDPSDFAATAKEQIRAESVIYQDYTLDSEMDDSQRIVRRMVPEEGVYFKAQEGGYREMVFYADKEGLSFEGGPHWMGDKNEIAHMRASNYRALAGLPNTFLVEEVQSDTHQKFRAEWRAFQEHERSVQEAAASGLQWRVALNDAMLDLDNRELLESAPEMVVRGWMGRGAMRYDMRDRMNALANVRNARRDPGRIFIVENSSQLLDTAHEMAHAVFTADPEFWEGSFADRPHWYYEVHHAVGDASNSGKIAAEPVWAAGGDELISPAVEERSAKRIKEFYDSLWDLEEGELPSLEIIQQTKATLEVVIDTLVAEEREGFERTKSEIAMSFARLYMTLSALEANIARQNGHEMPQWFQAYEKDGSPLAQQRLESERAKIEARRQELLAKKPPIKNWHEMVFRRAILEAVHNDMENFAWTAGDIHSYRWRQSKLPTDVYDTFWVKQAKKLGQKYGVEPQKIQIGTTVAFTDMMAEQRGESGSQPLHVWAMPITDEMKQDLTNTGMQLFQRENAWWANRQGDLVNTDSTHIRNVLDSPGDYGFTREELVAIYKKHGERIGLEGNAREEIIREMNRRNWMRIRHYQYPQDYWSLTLHDLKGQRRQVEDFIFRAMDELGMKPDDQLQVVTTADNQVQAWTFQEGGVKKALEEISMFAQRDPRYQAVSDAIMAGDWVEESVLGEFAGSPVVDAELGIRADLMSEAALFDTFEDFLDYVGEVDPDPSSSYYYQEIWTAAQELPRGAREVANQQWIEGLSTDKTTSLIGAVGLLGRSSELGQKDLVALAEWVRTHKRKLPSSDLVTAAQLELASDPGKYRQIIADITTDDAELAALVNEERTDRVKVELEAAIREAREARLKEADARARAEAAEETGEAQTAELRRLRARKSARDAMRDMRRRQDERAYKKKLIRNIMAVPSAAIDHHEARQIRDLQSQYYVNRSRRVAQLQEAMRGYADGQLEGTALAGVMRQQRLQDLSVEQLENLYQEVAQLKERGRVNRWMRLLQDRAEVAEAVEGIAGEVLKGHILEDEDFRGSVQSKDQLKMSIAKMFKKLTLRPSRVARWLTGGERGVLHDWLVRRVNQAEDATIRMTHERINQGTAKMAELGITPKALMEKVAVHSGVEFRVDDVLSMYIALQNEQSAYHLVNGNRIPMELAQEMISQLTPEQVAWADWMIDSFGEENYNRLMEVLVLDENRTAPRIDRYFPIKVEGQNYQFTAQEAASDIMSRSPYSRQYAKKGFTKSRVNRSAQAMRLGATKIWAKAVADQEAYINKGLVVKKLQRIVNDPQLQRAIRQEMGQPMNEWMQKFVNDWANPDIYRSHTTIDKVSRMLRNNAYLSYLGFNFVTMAKQLPSVAFYLPRSGGVHMLSAIGQFTANPKSVIEFVRANDPQVMDRAINRFQQELDLLEGGSYAQIARRMGKFSMKGIQMMDTMAVTIGWKAVYDRVLQEQGDNPRAHEIAVEEAQLATLETQPQARSKDLAEIYRSNEGVNWFLMFSNQLNQVWNMIAQDIPDDIRHHQMGRALATMSGIAISAAVIGWMNHRDTPEDVDELPEILGKYMLDQVVSAIPIVGGSVKAGMEGWFGTGVDPLPIASQTSRTARTLLSADADGGKKFDAMMRLMIEAMVLTGLPTVQTRRIHDTLFADRWFEDPQFDPWELIGGLD